MKLSPKLTTEQIMVVVCQVTGQQLKQVISNSRKRELVYTRQIYHYFCCKNGLQYVAHVLTGQDHATVSYGRDKITGFLSLKTEKELKRMVEAVEKILLNGFDVRLFCEKNGYCKYAATEMKFEIPIIDELEILVFTSNQT